MTVGKAEAVGEEDNTAIDDTNEFCVVLVGRIEKNPSGDRG